MIRFWTVSLDGRCGVFHSNVDTGALDNFLEHSKVKAVSHSDAKSPESPVKSSFPAKSFPGMEFPTALDQQTLQGLEALMSELSKDPMMASVLNSLNDDFGKLNTSPAETSSDKGVSHVPPKAESLTDLGSLMKDSLNRMHSSSSPSLSVGFLTI